MPRFSSPEDLSSISRNSTNTKALDLLQQHASQYYNTHKIHELNERANQLAKSPSSSIRLPSGNIQNSNVVMANNSISALSTNNNSSSGPASSQPSPLSANCDANSKIPQPSNSKIVADKDRPNSPPPQR